MGVANDRSAEGPPLTERRYRRTTCLAEALRFQLDACREAEGLAAIVVSDDLGCCVAHSGGDGVHRELARRLPGLVDPSWPIAGDMKFCDEIPSRTESAMVVTSFSVAGGTRLHACAVETRSAAEARATASVRAALERVASGFSRLLAQ